MQGAVTELQHSPVNRPISLVAISILALVVLAALYIFGLPTWLLVVMIVLVLALLVITIIVLIKWPQLGMRDEHLLSYVTERFQNFSEDAAQQHSSQTRGPEGTQEAALNDLDELRVEHYNQKRGLFLGHTWRFSEKSGQVADIIIFLHEHLDTSTRTSLLREGRVESVRYELGRRFFNAPVIKHNKQENFALEISAYRPMLCFAEVTFNDGSPPIFLSRYIDLATDSEIEPERS